MSLSLEIQRLELRDQPALERGITRHGAEKKKKPFGVSRLRRCCGCRGGGMSDRQSAWRGVQGAPGGGRGRGLLAVRARFAARLVLHLGHAAALAQPPVSQQPVCPREVLSKTHKIGRQLLSILGTIIHVNTGRNNFSVVIKTIVKTSQKSLFILFILHVRMKHSEFV